jgi:hypothetical protein
MATGDAIDMASRIRAVLPASWFPVSSSESQSLTPVLDGVLKGLGQAWSQVYSLLSYTKLQTRISTATEFFLDMIAADFFGTRLTRRTNESDTAFRTRICKNIFSSRATRVAVSATVANLTGRAPMIFEPAYTHDTGGYGTPAQGGGNMGYGVTGGWGSLALPFQFFIEAYRPLGSGISEVAGYGNLTGGSGMPGGYGAGAVEYGSLSWIGSQITDSDITSAIAMAIPAATIAWARIANP